jgi:hypothetical protein
MAAPLPPELEQRIAEAAAAARQDRGLTRADWLALALTAIAVPALILVLGWGR